MLKIGFYVPCSHLEQVKAAMFAAGAGRIGNYEQCCWQCLGEGQFKPQAGSSPYIGKIDDLEKVDEYRVEMVCEDSLAGDVVASMKQAHPYEEPAYDVIALISV